MTPRESRADDWIWYCAQEPYPGRLPKFSLIHVCAMITVMSRWTQRELLDPNGVGRCQFCDEALPVARTAGERELLHSFAAKEEA